jgi:hypothetical protein
VCVVVWWCVLRGERKPPFIFIFCIKEADSNTEQLELHWNSNARTRTACCRGRGGLHNGIPSIPWDSIYKGLQDKIENLGLLFPFSAFYLSFSLSFSM